MAITCLHFAINYIFWEIVMKIRFSLLTALLLAGFASGTYAARVDGHKAVKKVVVHAAHKAITKHVAYVAPKAVKKVVVHVASKVITKPVAYVAPKAVTKPAVTLAPKQLAKPFVKEEIKEIVKIDFDKEIKELAKNKDDEKNVYLNLSKKDEDKDVKYEDHGGDHGHGGKDDINAVPVPAAIWLFGSALLGLFGVNKRKSA
jgi:hypothetical protein